MSEHQFRNGQRTKPADSDFSAPRKGGRFSRMNEGWEYYRVPSEKSRKGYKNVGVYRGVYYKADREPGQITRHRLTIAGILLFVVISFVINCIQSYSYNAVWYVGLAEALTIVSLTHTAIVLVLYLVAEKEMTVYIYNQTSRGLINACAIAAFLLGACALSSVTSLIISGGSFQEYLTGGAGFSFLAACMVFVRNAELSLPYRSWQSTDTVTTAER